MSESIQASESTRFAVCDAIDKIGRHALHKSDFDYCAKASNHIRRADAGEVRLIASGIHNSQIQVCVACLCEALLDGSFDS